MELHEWPRRNTLLTETPILPAYGRKNLGREGRRPWKRNGTEGLGGNARASRLERGFRRKAAVFRLRPIPNAESGFCISSGLLTREMPTIRIFEWIG
jgi:hypothetical protein